MSDEIRTQVTEILAHAGVGFSARYIGEDKNAFGSGRTSDKWACTFTRTEAPAKAITFDYFMGIGHRKPARVYPYGSTVPAKPQAPHAADLLHSLILDSSAAGQSFESWCGEFGYDTDSRKALATYEACQRNGDKLRKLFARETLESLTSALQDY